MRLQPFLALLPLLSLSGTALADATASAGTKELTAPAGGGQPILQAAIVGDELVFRACEADPCPPSAKAERIQVGSGAEVSLTNLPIGGGRHVVWAHGPSFDAFVAALPGTPPTAKVLWSGPTGFADGDPGEGRGALVQVTEPSGDGSVHILVGEQHENVSLCGRPTLLAPRFLDPKDFSWKPAKISRLDRKERESASRLSAKRRDGLTPPPLAPLLRARVATSAVGDPGALTDGDPETTWAEGRKGDGRGEFVQLDVAADVPITALSFVVRPPKKKLPQGAAPSRFWLATHDRLFSISLPDDAWSHPGASYEVDFDPPLETSCMAIVLDEARTQGRKDAEVTFAEITARSSLDEAVVPALLVHLLNGGGPKARAARAILERAGENAWAATAERYADLDEAGRALALEVLDAAPCSMGAPVYLDASVSDHEGQAHHAKDRLRRCGREAGAVLVSAIADGPDPKRIIAAQALSLSAPDLAIPAILDVLPSLADTSRVELRAALARSSAHPRAEDVIRERLRDERAPAEATLSLLRSLPARPELLADAGLAYARLMGGDADFRARYLLLEPAARLASLGDARALPALRETLANDPDRHLRARAAEVAQAVPALSSELALATSDPEPRVREAAILALGKQAARKAIDARAVDALVERLNADKWTFVREGAADALAAFPASPSADSALGSALGDSAPSVRARALEAIGKRRATSQLALVRKRLDDAREIADIRARAARALGELCDAGSTDKLVKLAREGSVPMAGADAQKLAMSAIAALGRIHPADLQSKLAPLFGEGAPRLLSIAARAALDRKDVCGR